MRRALLVSGISFGFKANMIAQRLRRAFALLGRPRIRAVDHITIPVHDLELARRFYCDVLGGTFLMKVDNEFFRHVGRPVYDADAQGVFHVSVLFGGPTRVDLFQQRSGQAAAEQGHPHYAFSVKSGDLLKWKARLDAHGIPSDGPLQLGPPGQASLYFNDPFGNHLELATLGYRNPLPARPPEMARIAWQSEECALSR